LGLDYKLFVEVVKEIAKACASTAWIYVTHCAASYSLFASASEELKNKYLPKVAKDTLINLAQTEISTGTGISGMETTARKEGKYWILNGIKHFITNIFIVIAKNLESKDPFPKKYICLHC
jgi:alkylation response protein AidB-like acyl-CoA dehydrogenase